MHSSTTHWRVVYSKEAATKFSNWLRSRQGGKQWIVEVTPQEKSYLVTWRNPTTTSDVKIATSKPLRPDTPVEPKLEKRSHKYPPHFKTSTNVVESYKPDENGRYGVMLKNLLFIRFKSKVEALQFIGEFYLVFNVKGSIFDFGPTADFETKYTRVYV